MKKLYSQLALIFFLGPVWRASFAAAGSQGQTTAPSLEIAPTPSWVKPISAPSQPDPALENGGFSYLLVDRQENVGANGFYYHEVRKITSQNGVQNGAFISTYFKPTFEKLTFHSIQVVRNGAASNRLDRSRIKLVARESDPERSAYDVAYKAQIALDDVRVGDVIEYAWTIEGAYPLMRGKFTGIYSIQWSAPIVRSHVRLVYPANLEFAFRLRNGAGRPVVTAHNGVSEMSYDADRIQGHKIEDEAPDDYAPGCQLQISDFHDWAEVVQWATPLFDVNAQHSTEFANEVNKLRTIADVEQRVVSALQFVQNEIRYVGVRSWVGVYHLTAPDDVLRRRFADDKDKALLLLALLRNVDVDAFAALVSETYRSGVRELLPSPQVFDHVIVQVRIGKNTYWIDPTRGPQRGPLSQIYVARYGYALVLLPDTNELTAFEAPKESWALKKIVENYRVPAPEKDGELEVVSEYRGLAADQERAYFRDNTREEIQRRYLEYYTGIFPETKVQKMVWYEELPGENACRVTESYLIPKIWQLSDEKDRYTVFFRPGDIHSAIGSSISLQRADPVKLDYPNIVLEEVNIEMFEDWPFSSKGEAITTNFFRLSDEPTATGSHLQFNYSYETLKDRVEVNEIQKFNDAISKAKDNLGYSLTYRTLEQLERNRKSGGINWAIAAAAFSFFGAASFIAYSYFRDTKLPTPLPPPVDAPGRLNGIGGWLILLAIGQVLRPIGYIKTGYDLYGTAMYLNSWKSLTDPGASSYHPWWAPTLLFELFYDIVAFTFCVLVIALFFTKRKMWPRCFAAFLILGIVAIGVDSFFIDRIPAAAESVWVTVRDVGGAALTAAIWIPYVRLSKRVKATFRY